MCGINGVLVNSQENYDALYNNVQVMNKLIKHRGPDGEGIWINPHNKLALGHVRLSIIDLSHAADQPFKDIYGNVLVFNGEIYNYIELRKQFRDSWDFKTKSDTEVILAAYHKYGEACLNHLEGMFSFALWDNKSQNLFMARDRVGIKPFYYYQDSNGFYFSSEVKALLPFIKSLNINKAAFTEYLLFQYSLGEETLFDGVKQLMPGHSMRTSTHGHKIELRKYWDVEYSDKYNNLAIAKESFSELMSDSITKHLRSDVPIGSYLSGGVDSSLITLLAREETHNFKYSINGRFTEQGNYDESVYARSVTDSLDLSLEVLDINANDFEKNIKKISYHMDYPVAGPGVFPQYMVSKAASKQVKVMLGGQGGDELFGGYARYLLMYFGDVINHAIDGDIYNINLQPAPSNILSKLSLLKQYKPLFQQFMAHDCFASHDKRYFNIINRSGDIDDSEVSWQDLPVRATYEKYSQVFNSINMEQDYILNKVLHFDFKCLLPALLHVEDRVSMAHGLESRVPFLDHRIVEFAANLAPSVKFGDGDMKSIIRQTYTKKIPDKILNREDKMGFPVPLNKWANGELKDFIYDTIFKSNSREYINYDVLLNECQHGVFSRKLWGMLSLELWMQIFIDNHNNYKKLLTASASEAVTVLI